MRPADRGRGRGPAPQRYPGAEEATTIERADVPRLFTPAGTPPAAANGGVTFYDHPPPPPPPPPPIHPPSPPRARMEVYYSTTTPINPVQSRHHASSTAPG